jgi:hypothetical protein
VVLSDQPEAHASSEVDFQAVEVRNHLVVGQLKVTGIHAPVAIAVGPGASRPLAANPFQVGPKKNRNVVRVTEAQGGNGQLWVGQVRFPSPGRWLVVAGVRNGGRLMKVATAAVRVVPHRFSVGPYLAIGAGAVVFALILVFGRAPRSRTS